MHSSAVVNGLHTLCFNLASSASRNLPQIYIFTFFSESLFVSLFTWTWLLEYKAAYAELKRSILLLENNFTCFHSIYFHYSLVLHIALDFLIWRMSYDQNCVFHGRWAVFYLACLALLSDKVLLSLCFVVCTAIFFYTSRVINFSCETH